MSEKLDNLLLENLKLLYFINEKKLGKEFIESQEIDKLTKDILFLQQFISDKNLNEEYKEYKFKK
jgi:hypothetical protein